MAHERGSNMAEMIYRKAGKSGLKLSAISIGAWLTYGEDGSVDDSVAQQCIRTAIEGGMNYIDVADAYVRGGAEITVGKIIKDYERHKLVISTKAFWPMSDDINDRGLSRKHIMESVEKSLKRFDMDYIDIFYCHRFDPETPVEETVRAIDDLIRQGKILYWGTSMWSAAQIERGLAVAKEYGLNRPILEQPIYNMLDRSQVEGPVEETVHNNGIGLVVWSPLAGGMLTGKYNDGIPEGSRATNFNSQWFQKQVKDEDRLNIVRAFTQFAEGEMGVPPAALALAWAMKHRDVSSVITGATKPSHVESNLKALDVEITDEIEAKLEEILGNRPENSRR
jgi:voltage-dependent potassium channel beta subunit